MQNIDRQRWIIAVGLFVSLFFLWGSGYNTTPVFIDALLKAFGWSHAQVSWIPAAIIIAVGVTGPLAGWLLDRIDARIVMGTGAALVVGSFIAASRANTFTELLLTNFTIGVGLGASAWLPASVVIANWFGERRGTALGLTTAGMESGGMVMAFTVGHLVAKYGWRAAYFALSIPALLIALPFVAIVVRTRPEGAAKLQAGALAQALPGYEVGEAIRTRVFWMLLTAQLFWGLSAGVLIHLVVYLTGIGYTIGFAAAAYSVLAGLAALGKPLLGALADRIGGQNALGIALLMVAGSHLMALRAAHEWVLWLYLVAIGIPVASPSSLVPLVLSEALGLKRFGTLYGCVQVCLTLGLFGGPLIYGKLYDLTQSYTVGFEVAASLAVVGAVAGFLSVAPRPVGVAAITQPQRLREANP
jgi:MFS family permease